MSVVRLVFVLVTLVYVVTCATVMGVVVPPLARNLEEELANRSKQELATLVSELQQGLIAEDSLATYLPARAKREGWRSLRYQGPSSASPRVVEGPAGIISWRWEAARAQAKLSREGRDLGTLSLIAPSTAPDAMMDRIVGGGLLTFALLGGGMMLTLVRLLAWARKPLEGFHEQIRGLSERRFVSLHEPKVSEWVELSKSLNVMVSRVRLMLDERDQLVQHYRDQLDHDALTQTKSRESFMDRVADALEGKAAHTAVAIVRVHDLEGLNLRMGRARTDEFLVGVATTLRMKLMQMAGERDHVLARLNGADFGLLLHAPTLSALKDQMAVISKALAGLVADGLTDSPFAAWIGASTFRKDEMLGEVLLRVDSMLGISAAQRLPFSAAQPSPRNFNVAIAQWRVLIESALDTGRVKLQMYPVVDGRGRLIHHEAMLRLIEPSGNVMEAVDFIPPAIRNGRICDLDLKAAELALSALATTTRRIAVNVAQQSLAHPIFLRRLTSLLEAHRANADRLCFEVRELDLVGEDWGTTQALCQAVKPFGCQVGVDHFGMSLSVLPLLSSRAIRYVKLSPRFASRLSEDQALQTFVGVMVDLAKRLDIRVIANGITSEAEIEALKAAGVDGFTGPAVAVDEPRFG